MSSYTWDTYPAHGTSNFEVVARTALETWRTNGYSMEVRLNELEDGTYFSGVNNLIPSSALVSVEADKIGDGSLPVGKLDVSGTVTDGAAIVYRTAVGWTREPIEGVVGADTYQVRFSETGVIGFIESFISSSSEALAEGSGSLLTPETAKIAAITSSVNNLDEVSGTISLSPTHKVHIITIVGPTTIELINMDDASVEYMIDVVISNPNSYSVTWPASLEWVGGSAPSATTTTRLSLGTYTGGASYFGAESWSSGGVTGTYCLCSTETIPDGAALCDGSTLVRTATPKLFSLIGTIYGSGDGVTTYGLPDWRGYAGRGWDNGAGRDPDASSRSGGDVVGSTQDSQNKSHNHSGSIGSGGNHRHGFGAGFCSANGNGSNIWGSGCSRDGTHYTDYAGSHNHSLSIYSSGGSEARMINRTWAVAIWL